MHLNAHRSDLNDAPTRSQIWMRRLTLLALLLAAGVIILGAWTRLSDAGLGCPDWPGCYGHLDVRKAISHAPRYYASVIFGHIRRDLAKNSDFGLSRLKY